MASRLSAHRHGCGFHFPDSCALIWALSTAVIVMLHCSDSHTADQRQGPTPLDFRGLLSLSLTVRVKLLLLVGCLTSQQHASVSHGRICFDKCTCCHTERELTDQFFYLTQSQYTDTGPTSPSADPVTPDTWQGRHWSARFLSHWYDSTRKNNHGASENRTPDLSLPRRTP